MHEMFAGKSYWDARRSMIFAKHLRDEAANFRKQFLDSDDVRDRTARDDDWRKHKVNRKYGSLFVKWCQLALRCSHQGTRPGHNDRLK